ncbi:hypothetical protein PGT21_004317 [Puccinia graminis f. sp. tritici]|uniref:Uncharacterized protein n=1 Tax=Puccinia graminis f. sp. tritici TaxID=56615 RepID=A0A5B0M2M2_PUCGR|nr:hypothetical protein PGT21_004317 [Puccinia graminis f. sp. tritici]
MVNSFREQFSTIYPNHHHQAEHEIHTATRSKTSTILKNPWQRIEAYSGDQARDFKIHYKA